MADITIQINSPQLTGSEKFRVRYRLLPNGVFTSFVDRTNASFTLTGLADGQYEFEIIFVRENGEECPSTFVYYTIIPDYECIPFSAEMVQIGSLFYIEINYTQPLSNPPCGWEITYISQTGNVVPYATLPPPPIRIPVPNMHTTVYIRALLCNGRYKICFEDDIEPIQVECEPIVITEIKLERNPPPSVSWTLTVIYTQSTPATTNGIIVFNQTGIPVSGGQVLDSGVWQPVGVGGAGSLNRVYAGTVQPITTWGGFNYSGKFIDDCGVEHPFSVHAE